MLLTGMVEEKMYPVLRDHGLFVGSKCWEKDVENNWFSNNFIHLGNSCLWVWVIFFCGETAQMNTSDVANLDNVKLCPVLQKPCVSEARLAVQRYRKGKDLCM